MSQQNQCRAGLTSCRLTSEMIALLWCLRQISWLLPRRHLTGDCLLNVALGTTAKTINSAAARHLRRCPDCSDRFADIRSLVRTLPEAAEIDFKATFTPERLRSQRRQIGVRLAQVTNLIEPAKLIEFPRAHRTLHPFRLRSSIWPITAATGGLLIGLLTGQFIHPHPTPTKTVSTAYTPVLNQPTRLSRPASTLDITETIELPSPSADDPALTASLSLNEFERVISGNEFFRDLDLTSIRFQVTELESIDALTPGVRDVTTTVR